MQRQPRTAGRIENSQVGVFLAYASPRGRALIDRRLYLPETTWCADADRRTAASVPTTIGFATKPALAADMLSTALQAQAPARWFTADEVYGADPTLPRLEDHQIGYVMAIGRDRRVRVNAGRTRIRPDELAARLPASAWQSRTIAPGAQGPHDYHWAWITTTVTTDDHRWLLIRRNTTTGELAYCRIVSSTRHAMVLLASPGPSPRPQSPLPAKTQPNSVTPAK